MVRGLHAVSHIVQLRGFMGAMFMKGTALGEAEGNGDGGGSGGNCGCGSGRAGARTTDLVEQAGGLDAGQAAREGAQRQLRLVASVLPLLKLLLQVPAGPPTAPHVTAAHSNIHSE